VQSPVFRCLAIFFIISSGKAYVERTIARRNVIDNRTLVGIRPTTPVEGDGIARVSVRVQPARCGVLVAVYVGGFECSCRRRDESNVLIQSIPACSHWSCASCVVPPDRVSAWSPRAFDCDSADEAMGFDLGEEGGGKCEEAGERAHSDSKYRTNSRSD
jgi:hypothetical protein